MFAALWLVAVLGIMEVSLSFDNAVVNAAVLKTWSPFWQKLFLTLGVKSRLVINALLEQFRFFGVPVFQGLNR